LIHPCYKFGALIGPIYKYGLANENLPYKKISKTRNEEWGGKEIGQKENQDLP
jgi:hypothetical protein